MKAAQRFMRPVKEVREGFFTMADPASSPRYPTYNTATSVLGMHQISATRHFEEQYRSCAEDAGLIACDSFTASCYSSPRDTSRRYSRAATPRQVLGLGVNASDDEEEDSSPPTSTLASARTAQTEQLAGAASLALHKTV